MWIVACLLAAATPVWAQTPSDANAMLDAWDIPAATKAIDAFEVAAPASPEVEYLRARLDFFNGKYEAAVQRLDQAIAQTPRAEFVQLRDLVAATHNVTKNYKRFKSPKGYFEIAVEPGKDEVLLPFAFEALDEAYEVFAQELGFRPQTPIRIEVYPRTATLAEVSGLTDEEIRTSGTIALCKYNRLMITSPKALVRGYGWVDTVVHEYVHYVVNQKTGGRVPIWMHEGLAKYLERRWRGPDAAMLPPSSEKLLQERVKKGEFITFDQMHPSMAKLPSQEDAAMAFAEVYTAMEYLRAQVGPTAFNDMLDLIAQGMDAQRAFAKVLGTTFPQFEREWRGSLKTRKPSSFPEDSGFEDRLVFKDTAPSTELDAIPQPKARDHMHLGEMLQARDRFAAAIVQYRKAESIAGNMNPVLQTRLAQSLIATDQPQAAFDALIPTIQNFPGYVSTWIQLGKAAAALGRWPEAREYFTEAGRINPFDPEVHSELARVYRQLGMTKEADEFLRFEKLVKGGS